MFLSILIFTIVLGFVSGIMVGFSLGYIEVMDIVFYLTSFQDSLNDRILLFLVSILIFFWWLYFLEMLMFRKQKERTIAFNTASGQVTISLSAVEDFIKKLCEGMSEIREIKPYVSASRKGVVVFLKMALNPIDDISQFTSDLQEMVKEKVASLLGIDGNITIKIHVAKLIQSAVKRREKAHESANTENEEEVNIPYRQY